MKTLNSESKGQSKILEAVLGQMKFMRDSHKDDVAEFHFYLRCTMAKSVTSNLKTRKSQKNYHITTFLEPVRGN